MLALLRTAIAAAPLLAVALFGLGGSFTAGAVVWKFKDFWFTTFSEPAIRRDQRAIDVAEFERIAEEARRARELEYFKLVDRLATEFYEQQQMAEDWHQAKVDLLEDRIREYEQDLTDDGACGLTQRDLDFLGGVLAQQAALRRGSGQGQSGSQGHSAGSSGRVRQ